MGSAFQSEVYTLKAEIGKAPQKIRVETRYDWTSERVDILINNTDFGVGD